MQIIFRLCGMNIKKVHIKNNSKKKQVRDGLFFVVLEILIMNVNLPGNFVRKMVQKVQPGNRIMFVKWCKKFNQVIE